MPTITAKELATRCSIQPKNVHTYAARGKLVKRPDGLFDTTNQTNAVFIDKFTTGNELTKIEPKKETDTPEKKTPKREQKKEDEEAQLNNFVTAAKLNDLRAQKLKEEITQLFLKNQRLEGELIEVRLVEKETIEVVKAYRSTLFLAAENVLKNNMIDLGAGNDKLTKAVSDLQALFNVGCTNAIEQVKNVIINSL
jgi:hypothetical protein